MEGEVQEQAIVEEPAVSQAAEELQEAQAEEQVQPEQVIEDKSSRAFRQLARRESELRQGERSIKEMEAKLADYETKVTGYSELQSMAKTNPAKVLESLGIEYDDVTQAIINGGEPTEQQVLRQRNEVLEQRLAKLEEQITQRVKVEETQKYEKVYNSFVDEIRAFCQTDDDKYPLTSAREAYPLVAEHMQSVYDRTGEILDYEAAVSQVEDHLQRDLEAYLKHEKIRSRYLSPEVKPEEAISEPAQPELTRPKTLTNSGTQNKTESNGKILSRQESLARMAALIRGHGQ